jgi:hypothetical protein
MEFAAGKFVYMEGETLKVRADTVAELKFALKELNLRKKEYGLLKRTVIAQQQKLRSMLLPRDQLQEFAGQLERGRRAIDEMIRTIDSARLQVEGHILRDQA